jgi:ATP-binding cassette subfamily B protein
MFNLGLGRKALGTNAYDATTLIRRLLFEQALVHWRRFALAFVFMGISAGATALSAYVLRDVINQAYTSHNMESVIALSLGIMAMFVARGVATYFSSVILTRVGVRIVAGNQRRLYSKLLSEGLGYFATRHSSEFVARMALGSTSAATVINLLITAIGRDLLSVIGLAIVMIVQDPLLSLFSVIIAPPALLAMRKLVRRLRTVANTQFEIYTRTIEQMQETVQGIAVVKAFTLENHLRGEFDATVARSQHEAFKQARLANRSGPLMETLGGVAVAGTMIYCGWRVVDGGAEPGQFFSFLAAFLLAYEPAKRLARLNLDLVSQLTGVRALFEIIDSPTTEPSEADKPAMHLKDGAVAFDNVAFEYRPGEPVLRGISFTATPHEVTALVGPSGGGKSTILNLILRFYEVRSGRILIDDQNIADISRHSLRSQIAYVGQNVQLFRGSIRENIAFGKLGAGDSEIEAAAKAAHAHNFITAFPAGYDTPVGEHGLQLSGGQRQRISIARALIKDAPIILLDEATAALDSESERHVQEAIAELCRGRTTIVIAHRLSTVMHADTILVVENGRITETGGHEQLLRAGGRYATFYRLQLQDDHVPKAAE